jgi:hypothetical protein
MTVSRFEDSIRRVIDPELETLGFQYDGLRVFRRFSGNRTEIIEFQKGEGSMTGSFCVNLGIYTSEDAARFGDAPQASSSQVGYCSHWDRIGRNRKTRLSNIASALFGPLRGSWKEIFLPRDCWWKISQDPKEIEDLLNRVKDQITEEGLRWFQVVER